MEPALALSDSPDVDIKQLHKGDISDIMELENASWICGVKAMDEVFLNRLRMGHIFLGARINGELMAMTCFSYTYVGSITPENLPKSFVEFSSVPYTGNCNVAFGYSLSVHPKARGSNVLVRLLRATSARANSDGCNYLIGDGRCPSYNGSLVLPDKIEHSPIFKNAIDRYMDTGEYPADSEIICDPLLRCLYRYWKCEFIAIFPDFFPTDIPSGGFRVMYKMDTTKGY